MKKIFVSILVVMLSCAFIFVFGTNKVFAASEEYNEIDQTLNISYETDLTEECLITSNYQVTKTGHWVANWNAYDGFKFVPKTEEHSAGVMYNYLGVDNGPSKISRFYTMINNFEKGTVKVTVTLDKLLPADLVDLKITFFDVIRQEQTCEGDFTYQYNKLDVGKNQQISTYVDANYIGSLDSLLFSTKADTPNASFVLNHIKIECAETQSSTADGYFRGLDNGFNIVFNKLTRYGVAKEFDSMPVNLFSNESNNSLGNFDSGSHPNYGFNNGEIMAYNNELGEYLSFENGSNPGDNINGIWLKFPLDIERKLKFSVTLMKVKDAPCSEIKFEFMSAANKPSQSIIFTNYTGLPENKGLKDIPVGEWVTIEIEDFDVSSLVKFDSLGIWVDLGGDQTIYIRNASIYYDECGAERQESVKSSNVDNLIFSSSKNVVVESDYKAKEYVRVSLNETVGKQLVAMRKVNIEDGIYKVAFSIKKEKELSSDFTLKLTGVSNAVLCEKITNDFTEALKNAEVGQWIYLETDAVELNANDFSELRLTFNGEAELLLENISLIKTIKYISPALSLAVDNTLVRDFKALESMGMEEYDFSLNTFPEIGNWSSTFPDLLSQGQKVIYDNGVPVMKIYRRTTSEIEQAKVDFNWPEGREYLPATRSHFFITAPINVGYVEIEVTVKKCENFKGTSEFSLTGYTGKEPWRGLVNFTEELANAPVGEWVTFTKTIYLPEAIDSVMIRVETRYEDSDLLLKEVKLTTKSNVATGYYDASNKSDLSWIVSSKNGISTVKVNEEILDSSLYEYKEGMFILKQAFLDTLDNGSTTVEVSDGANVIMIDLSVAKVNPVLNENITYKYSKKSNLVVELDTRNSGISFIELNGIELALDVDYSYDASTSKLTIYNSVLSKLEAGNYTLTVKTRAGITSSTIILERTNSLLLILGISGGVVLVGAALATTLIIKRKKKGE